MRLKLLSLVMCLSVAATTAGAVPPADPDEWAPDAALVAQIDKRALNYELPKEFGEIKDYARYYWGTADHGHKVIDGAFLSSQWVVDKAELGKVHIVPEKSVPFIADGGCTQINIRYDLDVGKITNIECNFDLRPPPPPPSK